MPFHLLSNLVSTIKNKLDKINKQIFKHDKEILLTPNDLTTHFIKD